MMNIVVTGESMKKIIISGTCLLIVIASLLFTHKPEEKLETNSISGRIIAKSASNLTIQDNENIIYTFSSDSVNASVGDNIVLNYLGVLNKNTEMQKNEIVDYQVSATLTSELNENDLFAPYYQLANKKLDTLTLEEKIGQLFLVRYDENKATEIVSNVKPAGFVFYEKDFKNKTEEAVKNMINTLQKDSKIGLLTSVDEEGGKIVRVSTNSNLVTHPFKSPSDLYDEGGFSLIKQDTIAKSGILSNLGLNLNLAPVVDVATDPNAYMYERTLKKGTDLTSDYAKTVIEASKNTDVSYTLKHFPGYGNNTDTHIAAATDTRSYEDIKDNDLPPFQAGIDAGAEAVLVSHNTVSAIDSNNPASLSTSVHNLLRNQLKFTGIVITDDLDMGATSSIKDRSTKALLAGNDLIITTNYEESINDIKNALNNQSISEASINNAALRVLAWKYSKGLITEKEK